MLRNTILGIKKDFERVYCNLTGKPPKEWWHWHHKECGSAYRGCHPTKCPKNQYEETGVWKYKWYNILNSSIINIG